MGVCIQLPHVSLVMEYLPSTLSHVIKSNGAFDLPRTLHLSRDIARGLHHLHVFARIIHRDIKVTFNLKSILLQLENRLQFNTRFQSKFLSEFLFSIFQVEIQLV